MPDQTTKLRRKIERLQAKIVCYEAVQAALYETIDAMTRASVAAGVDVGWAEGERRDLEASDALDRDIQRLLDQDGNWS